MDLANTFVQLIENNAKATETKRSKIVGSAPKLADDEYLLEHPGASVEKDRFKIEQRPPFPRRYQAESVVGFCELVHEVSGLYPEEGDGANPVVVLVSSRGVLALLGERSRRETVSLPLEQTEGYRLLKNGSSRGLSHQAFVDMLRLNFKNEVLPVEFVPAVKKLKFNQNANGHSEVAVGRESMGRAVLTEALADGLAIAEEVAMTVQVFENINEDVSRPEGVRCGVLMDLRDNRLGLQPLAGELHSLMGKTLDNIATWLRANLPKGMTVVNGADWPRA